MSEVGEVLEVVRADDGVDGEFTTCDVLAWGLDVYVLGDDLPNEQAYGAAKARV